LIDESTYRCGIWMDDTIIVLYIGNVLVGTLEVDMPEKTFLINSYILKDK